MSTKRFLSMIAYKNGHISDYEVINRSGAKEQNIFSISAFFHNFRSLFLIILIVLIKTRLAEVIKQKIVFFIL
jgi:hypothetical protein